MKKFACPSCGAEVPFKSQLSVFAVCAHCSSMIVRRDLDVENLGKAASLPPDLSPIQLGTGGKWKNLSFEVVGRLKLKWEAGTWNEWCVFFSDGRSGWLAEAQGFFCLSILAEGILSIPPQSKVTVGAEFEWNGVRYVTDDIKSAECVAAEGELPFPAPRGRKSTSIDLTGPNGAFACLDYAATEPAKLYLGNFVELEEIQASNLRQLEGW